jgi:predicted membrane-bound dolichyl-phosphate-mannose-protein mannosyltransferase
LMKNPWGIVSLFDVYVGFFFFIGWVWYRESCPGIKLGWAIAILLGGNLICGVYAIIALLKSQGDEKAFFLGDGNSCPVESEET